MGELIPARWICAALTSIAAGLLTLRPRPAAARIGWSVLLLAGLGYALWLTLQPQNLVNINVVHHYLGAKYTFHYDALYRLVNAAVERPQVGMHDLDHPPARIRDDVRAQRAYYIDLLRAAGVAVDPLADLSMLQAQAITSGVVGAEADSILRAELPATQVEPFREDVRRALVTMRAEANIAAEGRDISQDYGFNGSPFWCVLRQLDPTVHRPFGAACAKLNLGVQTAAALATCWILGAALGAEITTRIAMAALLFASWDFVGWALPGNVFAEFWLPTVLALLAWRARRHALAGVAIACAGLIKLFPFVLLAPAMVHAILAKFPRPRVGTTPAPRRQLLTFGACGIAVGVLGCVSLLSGHAWGEFLHKIWKQFLSDTFLANSTSLSQAFVACGIQGSVMPRILSLVALFPILAMFRPGQREDVEASLPRWSLVLLAALGWVVHTWFNYYTVALVLALPIMAVNHPRGAGVMALAMAAATALPEFDDLTRVTQPVRLLKLAPYLLVPAWYVIMELRRHEWSWRARNLARAALVLWVGIAAVETVRWACIRRLEVAASAALDQGDAAGAARGFRHVLQLDPGNVPARLNEAIALWTSGDAARAGEAFARAVARAPENVDAREDYGRWLLLSHRLEAAEQELQVAIRLVPYDERVLFDLGRIRLAQGRKEEAVRLLRRARELRPEADEVRRLLAELEPMTAWTPPQ